MAVTPEQLEEMSVLELVNLKKELEERWGVSAAAAAPMMVSGAAPGAGGGDGGAEEEQTSFDVVLTAAGQQKIPVIKVIRELTGLGLKEAKDVVEAAPKAILEKVNKENADKAKAKLEAEGAKVTLK